MQDDELRLLTDSEISDIKKNIVFDKKIQAEKLRKEQEMLKKKLKFGNYDGEDKVTTAQELKAYFDNLNEKTELYETGFTRLDTLTGGFESEELNVISGITGNGKCHGKGTKILMFDGNIKNVEDIHCGDLLMGDDSTPREVLSLATGQEMLYTIEQTRGDNYVVNESHILSLKRTRTNKYRYDNVKNEKRLRKDRKGEVKDICLKDYINSTDRFKHIYKGYKVGVKFKYKKVNIDAYLLGIWLGDGSSNTPQITTADKEIEEYLINYADKNNFSITKKIQTGNKSSMYWIKEKTKNNKNRLREHLKNYNLLNNKHIPFNYKTNSRKIRLQLLAGIIDSDGTVNVDNCYTVTTKLKTLADDIAYIGMSLGFYCSVSKIKKGIKKLNFMGEYYSVNISGNVFVIPVKLPIKKMKGQFTKKDSLVSSIKVEEKGIGDYYGFVLNGNGRYLLGDFTVTHNTLFAKTLTLALSRKDIECLWFTYEESPRSFLNKFRLLPIFYLPTKLTSSSLAWVEERIIESQVKYNTKVVFIDHLHFLVPPSIKNVSILIGGVMRQLKTICLRHGITIFLIAHTNKINYDETPDLSHLRDSSFIAQEADKVFFVRRNGLVSEDSYGKKDFVFNDDAKIYLLKNRRTGDTGSVEFYMDRDKDTGLLKEKEII